MLHVTGLTFSIGSKTLLRDIGFSVEPGGFVSIIGPNGAGKSTLLSCILGLQGEGESRGGATGWKLSGEVMVNGKNARTCTRKELARAAAYVPQAGGAIPPFTVREFARLARYALPAESRDDGQAVARAFALTGMDALADRPLASLSGGERQKAYLAAALAQESPLLVLDEPTAFLDPKHAAEVHGLLKRLNNEQGLTVVTVTHDMNQPPDAGGNALALRHGEQIWYGPASDLTRAGQDDILRRTFGHPFLRIAHPVTGAVLIVPELAAGGDEA